MYHKCDGHCGQKCPFKSDFCPLIGKPGCICPSGLFQTGQNKCVNQEDCTCPFEGKQILLS